MTDYTDHGGNVWTVDRAESQQGRNIRTLLRLARRWDIPADEMIGEWAGDAGVPFDRLFAHLVEGDPVITASEQQALDASARRQESTMSLKSPNEWDHRKLIAVVALLVVVVLALIWWAWSRAKKVPVCHKQPWWPKAALGKKALDAGRAVFEYYEGEGKGDLGPGFEDLPPFEYWTKVTGRGFVEWVYSQAVLAYLREGDVKIPANLPPCVFDPAADCPACVEIKILWEEAQERSKNWT